ncbi:MAG: LytR family transcriptional regulator [Arthrobacter sp.]|nr:LytR family transcriptional regulator [Arthrobacter sp.]
MQILPRRAARLRRKKRRRRTVLSGLLALVLLVPGAASAYLFSLAKNYDPRTVQIEDAFPPEATRVKAAETPAGVAKPLNILVMGTDSRDTSDGAAATALAATASDQRADTLMLVHIPSDRAHVFSISLMRDLWINIPDHGEAKINAALAFGGVPLLVQTVESLLQQRIDHVVSIGFAGFKGLTDALGGVEVDVKMPFATVRAGNRYTFAAGLNTLNGSQALAFVRERYAFRDGDYQRVRNQQSFLRAVIAKTLDTGGLENPIAFHGILRAVSPYLSISPALDSVEIARLAFSLRGLSSRDTAFFTLPTAGIGTSADGQSIVLPDLGAIEEVKAALSEDRLGAYAAAQSPGNGN